MDILTAFRDWALLSACDNDKWYQHSRHGKYRGSSIAVVPLDAPACCRLNAPVMDRVESDVSSFVIGVALSPEGRYLLSFPGSCVPEQRTGPGTQTITEQKQFIKEEGVPENGCDLGSWNRSET